MEATPRKNKGLVSGLGILQILIGLGAVAGGLGLILEPSGASLGIPLDLLARTPFSTFLVPGIVLLIVNGFGSLAGAWASFKRYFRAGEIAMGLGLFLIVWIMFQVYWFASVHWLHVLYFGLGLLELILGWLLRKALRKALLET